MNSNLNDSLLIIPDHQDHSETPNALGLMVNNRPLIYYTIDIAKELIDERFICVSTSNESLIKLVNLYPLNVPFRRPQFMKNRVDMLREIVYHALDFYKGLETLFESVMILDPSFALRTSSTVRRVIAKYNPSMDLVATVNSCDHDESHPCYFENDDGYLERMDEIRKPMVDPVVSGYFINHAVLKINVDALSDNQWIRDFTKIVKVNMNRSESIQCTKIQNLNFLENQLKQQMIDR